MRLEFIDVSTIFNRQKQTYKLDKVCHSFTEMQNISVMSVHERSTDSLLSLISGIEQPTHGKIQRKGVFTNLIGDASYFHRDLSGEENIRFICKLYGQNSSQVIKNIKEFTEISRELKQKTKNYSPLLRRKIAISTSLFMKSDIYQLKGMISHPHSEFNERLQAKIIEISKESTLILASTAPVHVKKHTDCSIVINSIGHFQYFKNVQLGIDTYHALKKAEKDAI